MCMRFCKKYYSKYNFSKIIVYRNDFVNSLSYCETKKNLFTSEKKKMQFDDSSSDRFVFLKIAKSSAFISICDEFRYENISDSGRTKWTYRRVNICRNTIEYYRSLISSHIRWWIRWSILVIHESLSKYVNEMNDRIYRTIESNSETSNVSFMTLFLFVASNPIVIDTNI